MLLATEPGLRFTIRPVDSGFDGHAPLDAHQVHLWHIRLHDSDPGELQDLLSPDELERAGRFRFAKHRGQFVVTRGTLRSLLGSYLKVSPREIRFVYSEYGKPSLADPENARRLNFNLSHTEGMALFAFSRVHRIGVDVEYLRTDFRPEEIAERFFSLAERMALREIPAVRQHEIFFRIWTRKEAYIKARGEGLSHPLHQFDVSLDDAAALLATRPDPSEAQHWQMENLTIAPGFVAAAAVETHGASAVTR